MIVRILCAIFRSLPELARRSTDLRAYFIGSKSLSNSFNNLGALRFILPHHVALLRDDLSNTRLFVRRQLSLLNARESGAHLGSVIAVAPQGFHSCGNLGALFGVV